MPLLFVARYRPVLRLRRTSFDQSVLLQCLSHRLRDDALALSWITESQDGVRLRLLVQPRSGRSEIVGILDGALKIRIAAPPVDGAANKALVVFLSKRLGVPKTDIFIAGGERGRRKSVLVQGMDLSSVTDRLGDLD